MLKRGVAIILIACTLAANFTKLFVFAGFEMNQKYIASTLCENRDKPWMHCNGRCYLMKKIKLAEDKEKSNERETQKNLLQQVYFTTTKQITFTSHLLQVFPERYKSMTPQSVSISILQPPQLAS
ncbi:hypothetical protein HQ865_09695 [Mucilaginibacter mali]|uniref:Uncharacterized protein n=1 Tax=Mucilaginibacter mali TaxID=2740462 RepID=A0A7D4UAJ6_9SPHI|nr:hypothetical protein [Mucilaginibacter mali]QKJ30018.1 hypothetical protein HQ865_09695 [Mucilaginibacter mali]